MRSSRPYVQPDPAVIEQARQMDLLSYLRAYDRTIWCVSAAAFTAPENTTARFPMANGIGGRKISAMFRRYQGQGLQFVEAVEALTGGAVENGHRRKRRKDEPESSANYRRSTGIVTE